MIPRPVRCAACTLADGAHARRCPMRHAEASPLLPYTVCPSCGVCDGNHGTQCPHRKEPTP